jgi:hypothetical protein
MIPEGEHCGHSERTDEAGRHSARIGQQGTNVMVRTITIGAQLDYKAIIADACAKINLVCTHERHDDQGFEMLTQQHLLATANFQRTIRILWVTSTTRDRSI